MLIYIWGYFSWNSKCTRVITSVITFINSGCISFISRESWVREGLARVWAFEVRCSPLYSNRLVFTQLANQIVTGEPPELESAHSPTSDEARIFRFLHLCSLQARVHSAFACIDSALCPEESHWLGRCFHWGLRRLHLVPCGGRFSVSCINVTEIVSDFSWKAGTVRVVGAHVKWNTVIHRYTFCDENGGCCLWNWPRQT